MTRQSETAFLDKLRHDLLPSLVVFLVALPLCMGIAIASGAPVSAGLVTGIIGGIVVGSLAGSPLQVSGPAAGLTVIVYGIVQKQGLEILGLAVLFAGLVQIAAGLLRAGQWFRAVAPAVVQGMLSGIGILIFAGQFHVMVDDTPKGGGFKDIKAIPHSIGLGLPLPEMGTQEQRVQQRDLLGEVRKIQDLQSGVAKRLKQDIERGELRQKKALEHEDHAQAAEPILNEEQIKTALTTQQQVLEQLTAVQTRNEKTPLSTPNAEVSANFAAALQQSIESVRNAETTLKSSNIADIKAAMPIADEKSMAVTQSIKSHAWAGKVGLLALACMLIWPLLVKKTPLKMVPPQLVAVVVATVLCAALALPVLYVNAPEKLIDDLHTPNWGSLANIDLPMLLQAILTLAVVASAETLLCATAVDQMHTGPRTQYDRELVAQGIGNTLCGFLGALPMTGVIVRSAANVQAGGKTRWSAIFHGIWLLVFVVFLGFLLRLIPTASLAAILVLTGYKLMNFKVMKRLARFGWGEVFIYIATVLGVVFIDLLNGVLIGIALSALKMLLKFSKLEMEYIKRPEGHAADLHLRGAATFLKLPLLAAQLEKIPGNTELHIHFDELTEIDHACFELLINWQRQHETQGGKLVLDWERLAGTFAPTAQIPQPRVKGDAGH